MVDHLFDISVDFFDVLKLSAGLLNYPWIVGLLSQVLQVPIESSEMPVNLSQNLNILVLIRVEGGKFFLSFLHLSDLF